MKELTNVLRYLLLVLVWLLSATFIVCLAWFVFGRHQSLVSWPFIKEYGILLAVLLGFYYLIDAIHHQSEESY